AGAAFAGRLRRRAGEGVSEERYQHGEGDECEKRLGPPERLDEALADRRERELAEGAARRADSERHRAPFGRRRPRDRAEDDGEAGAADAEPDENARTERELERRAMERHHPQARGAGERAGQKDTPGPAPVGACAEERLRRAPDDLLDRDREAEARHRPAEIGRDRVEEEPEALADAHADGEDQRAAEEEEGELQAWRSHRGEPRIGGNGASTPDS